MHSAMACDHRDMEDSSTGTESFSASYSGDIGQQLSLPLHSASVASWPDSSPGPKEHDTVATEFSDPNLGEKDVDFGEGVSA